MSVRHSSTPLRGNPDWLMVDNAVLVGIPAAIQSAINLPCYVRGCTQPAIVMLCWKTDDLELTFDYFQEDLRMLSEAIRDVYGTNIEVPCCSVHGEFGTAHN